MAKPKAEDDDRIAMSDVTSAGAIPVPVAPPPPCSNERFTNIWGKFYDQATCVANRKIKATQLSKHRERVTSVLHTMTKLIFGLDEAKKVVAVKYGVGSIRLVIQLIDSAQVLSPSACDGTDDALLTSALKAIRCCVVRNAVGRTRCRSSGAFAFFSAVLKYSLEKSNAASLVDEALTVLAATCLGDDLNALQGAIELRHFVKAASIKFDAKQKPGLNQKIIYLTALFDAIEKEQRTVIDFMLGESLDFFKQVTLSEASFRTGLDSEKKEKCLDAETHYSEAIDTIERLVAKTSLLENLNCQLHEHRSAVRLALKDYKGSLADGDAMMSEFKLSTESAVRIQTLRAEAYEGLGRTEAAKETLGKILIADPQNRDIRSKLQKMSLS